MTLCMCVAAINLKFLIIVEAPILKDNLLVRIEENSENVPIDLLQEPAPFPAPTSFQWYKNGQRLTEADRPLTYSNVTFSTVRREDTENYTVSATNFVIGSNTEQVGNDTGNFYLDVICKFCIVPAGINNNYYYRWTIFPI